MLTHGPRSGYGLRKLFAERVGHFWSESIGQIYPTLRALERDGLVVGKVVPGEGRPAQTVYAITDAGREALRVWLLEPVGRQPVRNELLLKLYFGSEMGAEAALRHVERYRAMHEEIDALLRAFEPQLEREARSDEEELFWHLTLSAGQHVNRARLEWCAHAERLLREHLDEAVAPVSADAP